MTYAYKLSRLASALGLCLLSTAALAGGYGGGSGSHSGLAPQEAQVILSYADYYSDGDFRVRHTESAGATAQTGVNGESAFGFGSSETDIESSAGATSHKRTVQRGSAYAANGSASASGFSATLMKVRTNDGKWYVFRGYANAGATAGPGGTSGSGAGFARSAGGRY